MMHECVGVQISVLRTVVFWGFFYSKISNIVIVDSIAYCAVLRSNTNDCQLTIRKKERKSWIIRMTLTERWRNGAGLLLIAVLPAQDP
jgi:hypothetical protein